MDGQRDDGQDGVERRQSTPAGDVEDVVVTVGGVVELVVDDLPGAGYRWVLRAVPAGLVPLEEEPEPRSGAVGTGTVGGVARRTVRLRAEAVGRYPLELVFVRPWEPAEVPAARVRHVTVTVT